VDEKSSFVVLFREALDGEKGYEKRDEDGL